MAAVSPAGPPPRTTRSYPSFGRGGRQSGGWPWAICWRFGASKGRIEGVPTFSSSKSTVLSVNAGRWFGVLASSAGTVFRQGREAGAELLGTLGAHVEVFGRPAQRLRDGLAGGDQLGVARRLPQPVVAADLVRPGQQHVPGQLAKLLRGQAHVVLLDWTRTCETTGQTFPLPRLRRFLPLRARVSDSAWRRRSACIARCASAPSARRSRPGASPGARPPGPAAAGRSDRFQVPGASRRGSLAVRPATDRRRAERSGAGRGRPRPAGRGRRPSTAPGGAR